MQGLYSFPLMRLNGARYGVREHVLQTAALLPNNLILMTNCLVTKVLFASVPDFSNGGWRFTARPGSITLPF